MSNANKALVQRFWDEVINKGHLDLIDDLVSPGFVWHGPGARDVQGPAGLKQLVGSYLAAFPDLKTQIHHQVAEGDSVASRLTVQATHRGELEGIAPTGNPMKIDQINIIRLDRGKLVELWDMFDELAMMRQIGAVPASTDA